MILELKKGVIVCENKVLSVKGDVLKRKICRMHIQNPKMAVSFIFIIHGINKYAKKGETFMNETNCISYDSLAIRVQQQEEAITQLLVIIAATNRKLSDLIEAQNQATHSLTHS